MHTADVIWISVRRSKPNDSHRSWSCPINVTGAFDPVGRDDTDTRLALRDFLTEAGFVVYTAQLPRLQGIPVVILSAATREWSGAHLEVEEVLSKPVDLEVLLTTVNRIFAERL